jgi:hypothetical protein
MVGNEQEVEVVREDRYTADANRVQALGSSEDAEDEVVELTAWTEEHTALHGPPGDGDEGFLPTQTTESSRHSSRGRKGDPMSLAASPRVAGSASSAWHTPPAALTRTEDGDMTLHLERHEKAGRKSPGTFRSL